MRRSILRSAVLVAAAALALVAGAGSAGAEPPSRIGPDVTDHAGVLAPGDEARITEAFGRLREAEDTQLFVVYVDSFDGRNGFDWANEAADQSQFGRDDVLLAVAVEDRAYGISVAENLPISEARIDSATADAESRLAEDDWAGAAIALADGLHGGSGIGTGIAVAGAVAAVGGGAYLLSRRRRGRPAEPGAAAPVDPPVDAEFADVSTADLAYRASAELIEVDEAVRTSEIELTSARTHFGEEAAAPFVAALEASRADMIRAFDLKRRLDAIDAGETPGDETARRALCADVIRACRAADDRLDAQVAAFDRLRNLEATAPAYLAGLAARHTETGALVAPAAADWAALTQRYAPSALEAADDNVDQAGALLTAAREELDAADTALSGGRAADAVVSGRAAEDALTQARTLVDGIARLRAELADATARIPAARAAAEQDLAEARALDAPGSDVAPVVARAEAALASAAEAAAGTRPDPLAALRLIAEADEALDAAIAAAREAREENRRTGALLEQTLVTARSSVAAARDYVATHRGAVGPAARTRLVTAERHLQLAESGGDPAAALREAQQADAAALDALRTARHDTTSWQSGGGWSGGGWSGGGAGGQIAGRVAGELGGLILGGILSGGSGGGGRSRSRGGGGSPGSFGGSASRGRRGGGGRF